MQRIERIIIVVLFVALLWVWKANAGTPAGPDTAPASTEWYKIEDIYNRLSTGTAGSKSRFTEPSATPGTGTMHTLNDVMDKAPAKDDTNGATKADVVSGKTFWGLRSGQWGQQTGTASVGSNVTGTDGKRSITIPDGFYSGSKTATAQDSDLAAGNIKKDVDIFGVTGTFEGGSTYQASVPKTGAGDIDNYTQESGEDGHAGMQKGVDWPNPRFTDNNDGTVTDKLTGLIWLKNANCANEKRNWVTALSDVTQLNSNGTMNGQNCRDTSNGGSHQSDWRLPNVRELQSLIDYGESSPALPSAHPFDNIQADLYWSSSTVSNDTSYAWYVSLKIGIVNGGNKTSSSHYVWPVRGGKPTPP